MEKLVRMVSLKLPWQLQKHYLSTRTSSCSQIKQVTRGNFTESLDEIKTRISDSQFVAISLSTTGSYSSAWHNVLPFDTTETAYLKTKCAAERFQIFQFAICPFTISASKVIAYPYGFHLFPRDEQNLGMPCYSFSCQSSVLKSLVSQGFDFNTCIYDGISYLSREQESVALSRLGRLILVTECAKSVSSPTTADSIFCERTKSRVRHWRDTCKDSNKASHDALVRSLRKLVFASEEFYSRPSLIIDVSSEHQASLVSEMLQQLSDDMVPFIVQGKRGEIQAVRVVLTASNEDKALLQREIMEAEDKQKNQLCGFREVIDFISDSQTPIVSSNSLYDLVFMYSKFFGSAPMTVDDFVHSISKVFPHVIDVNNLMKAVAPQSKGKSIAMALNHLKNHFFAPISLEIPNQVSLEDDEVHGHPIVMTAHLIAKLCHILKISPKSDQTQENIEALAFGSYYKKLVKPSSDSLQSSDEKEVRIWSNNPRHVKCSNVVFLWGFEDWITAGILKSKLQVLHSLLNVDFDVRLLEKSCAILVFSDLDKAKDFLQITKNETEASSNMSEVFPEGLKATSYDSYDRVCKLGLFEENLGDALERALDHSSGLDFSLKSGDSLQLSEWLIDFDDL